MDLRTIISSTRAYNLHTHTQYCDGRADMARFVASAVEAGYEHLGFTPHSPIPIPSPCNMELNDVDRYIKEFYRLQDVYRGRINLYMSMEIDFLGEKWGASIDYFKELPLDYRLSSIHFIPTQDGELIDVDGSAKSFMEKMRVNFKDDIRYVVDTFYARTLEMIELGGFDMIGHFDKIGSNASRFKPGIEEEEWYQDHIESVVKTIKDKGLVAEINTKAWLPPVGCDDETCRTYNPRLFPSPRTIIRLIEEDVPLAVNSDVHFTERITAGRVAAFGIIDSVAQKV